MKEGALIGIVVVGTAIFGGCRRHDYRTVRIDVPGMKNEACREIVLRTVKTIPGVRPESIRCDHSARCVVLTYDSLVLSMKNIEMAIAKAGFDANDVPADPAAAKALPAECR
ncbi:MAG: heavy-metal-associated domain-containing protein [Kiritimatiellae bacterium]|nr:heavy-metal-associated domain-containing protein [Kiritimatiellia bacterium]